MTAISQLVVACLFQETHADKINKITAALQEAEAARARKQFITWLVVGGGVIFFILIFYLLGKADKRDQRREQEDDEQTKLDSLLLLANREELKRKFWNEEPIRKTAVQNYRQGKFSDVPKDPAAREERRIQTLNHLELMQSNKAVFLQEFQGKGTLPNYSEILAEYQDAITFFQLELSNLEEFKNQNIQQEEINLPKLQGTCRITQSNNLVIGITLSLPKGEYRILLQDIHTESGSAYKLVSVGAPLDIDITKIETQRTELIITSLFSHQEEIVSLWF